jgi:hypothetical protein
MKVPVTNPWNEFFNVFKEAGHEIVSEPYGSDVGLLVANHHSEEAIAEADKNSIPKGRRVVILWEPYIVEKVRYEPKNYGGYGIRLAPSLDWSSRIEGEHFFWPQDNLEYVPNAENWVKRKRKFVLVQGNKFSARKGEQYSLRRKILWKNKKDIEFFGIGWHQGLKHDLMHWIYSAINSSPTEISLRSAQLAGRHYANYLGPTKNKVTDMSKYQFSLVIENSTDYISEKLFDSVGAGCVTIYVGPKLSTYGIDKNAAIEIEPNYRKISAKMKELLEMPQQELKLIAQTQHEAMAKAFPKWENKVVLRKLATKILSEIS